MKRVGATGTSTVVEQDDKQMKISKEAVYSVQQSKPLILTSSFLCLELLLYFKSFMQCTVTVTVMLILTYYLITGFEYCVEATLGGYGPVEKTYHLCRRRRWLRNRTLVADMKHEAKMVKDNCCSFWNSVSFVWGFYGIVF